MQTNLTTQPPPPSQTEAMVKGNIVPDELIGRMRDSKPIAGDPAALRARFAEEGYLYFRGLLDPEIVRAARAEVLARIEAVGEVRPGSDGIFTGASMRAAKEADLGAFWKSVSEGPKFRAASRHPTIARVISALAEDDVQPQDYVFLRVSVPGRATELHFDYPFFARDHDKVWTVWLPIGDAPMLRGPLVVVEGSHKFADLVDSVKGHNISENKERKAAFGTDAISFARERGTRLLSADFQAGDFALFGMYTAHASLDHHDATGRVRVSCDLRWQGKSMPMDERYFGPNPGGTTGAGYRELNGANPLDQPWHIR
jgi:ectoine hydroxylase-related dioxygenase (phytanoyl-CoA dioxygenase family)